MFKRATNRTFLVGTSHVFQRPPLTRRREAAQLYSYLKLLGKRCSIRAIGEELNQAQLAGRNLERSTCAEVALSLGIEHRYCEPSDADRNLLGICVGKDGYSAREQFWLSCLLQMNLWPCLFVCGAKHVGSFFALLAANKLAPVVACKDWSPDYSRLTEGTPDSVS